MITVAALSPSLDLTYELPTFRLGRVHRSPGPLAVAGGKPLNLARAARSVGADVRVVALLGGSTGARVAALAADEGLPLVVVDSGVDTRSCVSVAAADTGELTEVYEDARPVPAAALDRFAATLVDQLAGRPGWLALAGRAPTGAAETLADLVHRGREQAGRVAVDTHGEGLPPVLAAGPDLVKVNRAEAAELLGRPEDADLTAMAREVHGRHGGVVVLTDGTAGAVAVDAAGSWRVGPSPRRGRYPVGSGDSFLGGLLAALEEGQALPGAVRLATGCAVANALVPGQGRFDPDLARTVAGEVEVSATS